MSRSRATAPTPGAALLFLALMLLPAISLALPAGTPPLSPETRAALSSASLGRTVLPWQRQVMQRLAGLPAAPSSRAGIDGQWTQLPPPMIEEAAAVYDPVGDRMLFFGGRISNSDSYTNDVWALTFSDVPTWSLVATDGAKPAPRAGHVLLYDSTNERLLLFGGADSVTRNDCWALDLTTDPPTWEEGFPTGTLPARRAYCQAVYDPVNDVAFVFGGADSVEENSGPVSFLSDLWVLPLTDPLEWIELTPTGTPPSPRAGAAVVYDGPRQRMVLFGGYDGGVLDDGFTLSLDPNPDWAPLGATGGPPPARAVPSVVLDASDDRMVMYGGLSTATLGDVWALDLATTEWTELFPSGGPPSPRQQAAAVYDEPRDRMVMVGGNSEGSDSVVDPMWSLSLGSSPEWTDLGGRHPARRWDAASAVDPTRQVMWVHGGQGWEMTGPQLRTDLWSLSLGTTAGWSEAVPSGTPPGKRYGHSAIYDALRDRLVFFGGNDSLSMLDEVWELSLSGAPAWNQLSPSGTPPSGRMYHSSVYDAVNDRMVVFGGWTGVGLMNDVWALSFADPPTWTPLAPTGALPPPLFAQSAALDQFANRLVIFGGTAGAASNSVYALTLSGSPAWSQVIPSGAPPPARMFAPMVSLGGRMVVTGGNGHESSFVPLDDTWLLSLYPSPEWRQLDVGPTVPGARLAHAAGFDQTSFTLSIFGGQGMTAGDETWTLQLDEAVPALVSLVSANAQPGRVELSWEVASALESATVQRSADGGSWNALGRVLPDGSGRLTYVDVDVVAGARYGYRLELPGGGFSAEAWVDIPSAARFALRGMTPNPSSAGAGLVAFTLPDGSPARLEVMDVTGRQVYSREVGGLGQGQHFVRVSGAEPLAPGVYLVRLTRGGQSLTAKAVTTR